MKKTIKMCLLFILLTLLVLCEIPMINYVITFNVFNSFMRLSDAIIVVTILLIFIILCVVGLVKVFRKKS